MSHNCETEHFTHTHSHTHSQNNDHSHEHDHTPLSATNPEQSLYQYIDTTKIKILNGVAMDKGSSTFNSISKAKSFIKTQDEKFKIGTWLQSDADCQLAIQLPFTGICKIDSIILRTNKPNLSDEFDAPKTIQLYKNWKDNINLDFDTLSSKHTKVDYHFEHPQNNGIEPSTTADFDTDESNMIEHFLPKRKFNDCHSITIFVKDNWSNDEDNLWKLYYIELRGEFIKNLSKDNTVPLMTVYESAPNPLDHQKLEADKDTVNLGM